MNSKNFLIKFVLFLILFFLVGFRWVISLEGIFFENFLVYFGIFGFFVASVFALFLHGIIFGNKEFWRLSDGLFYSGILFSIMFILLSFTNFGYKVIGNLFYFVSIFFISFAFYFVLEFFSNKSKGSSKLKIFLHSISFYAILFGSYAFFYAIILAIAIGRSWS